MDVRRFTYADIEKEANRMANVLKHRYGVKPGDHERIFQAFEPCFRGLCHKKGKIK